MPHATKDERSGSARNGMNRSEHAPRSLVTLYPISVAGRGRRHFASARCILVKSSSRHGSGNTFTPYSSQAASECHFTDMILNCSLYILKHHVGTRRYEDGEKVEPRNTESWRLHEGSIHTRDWAWRIHWRFRWKGHHTGVMKKYGIIQSSPSSVYSKVHDGGLPVLTVGGECSWPASGQPVSPWADVVSRRPIISPELP